MVKMGEYNQMKVIKEKSMGVFLDDGEEHLQALSWAARLHEVGISVAHSGYHKHSAYILGNADMPGFSQKEQERLSMLALAHRGDIGKARGSIIEPPGFALLFALRLAALFHRSRCETNLPRLKVSLRGREFSLCLERKWLERNPLTHNALLAEIEQWDVLGFRLDITKADGSKPSESA